MYKTFTSKSSSRPPGAGALGRPLIGALLRFPREVVVQRMLEALNEHGYDLTPPELAVMTYPGPTASAPASWLAPVRRAASR